MNKKLDTVFIMANLTQYIVGIANYFFIVIYSPKERKIGWYPTVNTFCSDSMYLFFSPKCRNIVY